MTKHPPQMLDLLGAYCPMAFVKARLHLDALSSGDITTIVYEATPSNEPLVRSIRSLGHTILSEELVDPASITPESRKPNEPQSNDYVQVTLLKIEVNR